MTTEQRIRERVELRRAIQLMRAASAHVFRQQFAGKHEQDRLDAVELVPQIDAFLKAFPR